MIEAGVVDLVSDLKMARGGAGLHITRVKVKHGVSSYCRL